jgi:hypothetical protein
VQLTGEAEGAYVGICKATDINFYQYASDTDWLIKDTSAWLLSCKYCEVWGNGKPTPKSAPNGRLELDDRVGILLDLSNGGSIIFYRRGREIARVWDGVAGPVALTAQMFYHGAPPNKPFDINQHRNSLRIVGKYELGTCTCTCDTAAR